MYMPPNLPILAVPHRGRVGLPAERVVRDDRAEGDDGAEHVQALLLEVGLQGYV